MSRLEKEASRSRRAALHISGFTATLAHPLRGSAQIGMCVVGDFSPRGDAGDWTLGLAAS